MDRRRFFSRRERSALRYVAGNACEDCGVALDQSFHADHNVPFASGGATDLANGRALCRRCNLSKGAMMPTDKSDDTRRWQVDALRKVRFAMAEQRGDFLTVATPGAGKTRHALAVVGGELQTGRFEKVLVVGPTGAIEKQWVEEAAAQGIVLTSKLKNCDLRDTFMNQVVGSSLEEVQGLSLTYQELARDPMVYDAICSRWRTIVVFDEVHHLGDQRSWGAQAMQAFARARFRLSLSGTPFRSDGRAIPFQRYDSSGMVIPDHHYTYREAVRDGVCRPIVFPSINGEMEWIADKKTFTACFDTPLDKRNSRRRLSTALRISFGHIRTLLTAANDKLYEIRAEDDPRAAGIAFAVDMDHARRIAEIFRRELGVNPVCVLSDDPDAKSRIEHFREGTEPWIVCVRMVSEGVDIPRLCVGAYATNVMEALFAHQAFGRIIRVGGHHTAYMFVPKAPEIRPIIDGYNNDVIYALVEQKQKEEEDEIDAHHPNDKPRMEDPWMALGASGREDVVFHDGMLFTLDELRKAREAIAANPALARFPDYQVALVRRSVLKQEGLSAADGGEESPQRAPSYDAQVEEKRKQIKRLIAAVADRAWPDDPDRYQKAHDAANKSCGIPKQSSASLTQLTAKIAYLKDMLLTLASDKEQVA